MKLQKGMTLIEVIVAILLLTLITTLFTNGFMEQLRLMKVSRDFTEKTFQAAKVVESKIMEYKTKIKNGEAISDPTEVVTVFSGTVGERTVSYYPILENIKGLKDAPTNKDIYSIVTDDRAPSKPLPVITSVDAYLTLSDSEIDRKVDGYYATADVKAVVEPQYSNLHLLLMTKYQWYISEPSFPLSWRTVSVLDFEVGVKWPKYPDNFSLIPNALSSSIEVTPEMAGRHLLCIATPSSLIGELGKSFLSVPQYIYGLTVLNNLAAHFDASLIEMPGIGVGQVEDWYDNVNELKASFYGATPPVLQFAEYPKPAGRVNPIYGKAVSFNASTGMDVPSFPVSASENFTMFAVVLSSDVSSSSAISCGSAWSFNLSGFSSSPALKNNEWLILAMSSDGNRYIGDQSNFAGNVAVGDRSSGGVVKIGGSDIAVAEIIAYDTILSDDDRLKVTEYLGEKYNLRD